LQHQFFTLLYQCIKKQKSKTMKSPIFSLKSFLFLLASLLLSGLLPAQPVDNERNQANPTTKYRWFHYKSESEVNALASEGYRLIDLEVVNKSPFRFSGTMVKNSGAHQKAWGWYYGLTSSQVEDTANKYGFRAIDIEVYRDGTKKRLAVAFVKNTGSQYVSWWYYTDRSLGFLINKAEELGARIYDLDTYNLGGQRRYSGVMIRNTGKNYKAWWVFNNRTGAELLDLSEQYNARITDLERKGDNNYVAILERNTHPDFQDQFVLWRGESSANVTEVARHFGARIIDLEPYIKNGKRYFDMLLLDNTNALTTRIGNLLRNNTDGNIAPYSDDRTKRGYTIGLRLKEVGGPVKASLQSNRKFYPASTIKVLQYWYIHRAFMQNSPDPNNYLNNTGWWVSDDTINCSTQSNLQFGFWQVRNMRWMMRRMMRNSSNAATNAIQDYAGSGNAALGRATMNSWAYSILGLSNRTALKHKLACGNVSNAEPNIMVLKDLNKLYEKVFSDPNALNPDLEGLFIQNMLNINNNFLQAVVFQEGIKLGMTGAEMSTFIQSVRLAYKAGNIGDGYHSIGGWVELPYFCGASRKQFTFSAFWDRATTRDKQNTGTELTVRTVAAELLREEISKAMASCRILGFAYNANTQEPIPGATVELEQENAAGGFDPVRPSSANISPTTNPATTSRGGAYGWSIFQRGHYRVKATAPGFQTAYSDTFKIRQNGRKPRNKNILLEPLCPTAFQVATCPDQYLAPHYPGRQVARVTATASGGQVPYSYQWSTGATGEEALMEPLQLDCPYCDSFPPNPSVNPYPVTYTVTATDAQGCRTTATHTVYVADISCSSSANNIEMCQYPGTRQAHTQCISADQADRLLATGDWALGACGLGIDFNAGGCGNPQGGGRLRQQAGPDLKASAISQLKVYPNPFGQRATIQFFLDQPTELSLEVFDVQGKRVQVLQPRTQLQAGEHTYSLEGNVLPSGVYIIKLQGRDFVKTFKSVKGR
jgi:hypothetical protein